MEHPVVFIGACDECGDDVYSPANLDGEEAICVGCGAIHTTRISDADLDYDQLIAHRGKAEWGFAPYEKVQEVKKLADEVPVEYRW